MRFATFLLVLLGSTAAGVRAQWYGVTYRPPGAHYRVLRSPHFELIYQQGRESEARVAAALLEAHYDSVRALVGVRHDFRMPVIVNDYRDQGNGFVSALPFRQEFDLARLRGLAVAPTAHSWLHAVAPHELVHAAHAELNPGLGIGWGLRLLGPDWSRLLNLWAPAGFAEGVAVFYESRIEGGAGRLHFPFFNMEFRAAMASDHPWRLAQLLEAPTYTWPFDRHYNGGGHLHQYLVENGKPDFFRRDALVPPHAVDGFRRGFVVRHTAVSGFAGAAFSSRGPGAGTGRSEAPRSVHRGAGGALRARVDPAPALLARRPHAGGLRLRLSGAARLLPDRRRNGSYDAATHLRHHGRLSVRADGRPTGVAGSPVRARSAAVGTADGRGLPDRSERKGAAPDPWRARLCPGGGAGR